MDPVVPDNFLNHGVWEPLSDRILNASLVIEREALRVWTKAVHNEFVLRAGGSVTLEIHKRMLG
jgi:hypothetical protein